MARTAILDGVKARGLTAASATIATPTVSYYSDGTWDFVGTDGVTRIYDGRNYAVNALLTDMFTGTGGLNVSSPLGGNGGNRTLSLVAPTLTSMAAVVDTVVGLAVAEVTFAEIAAQGNEADADGTVTGFKVIAVSTGTLTIGASVGVATAWAAGTNDLIYSGVNAYWTAPVTTGTRNAFTVKARDNDGNLSATAIQVQLTVT